MVVQSYVRFFAMPRMHNGLMMFMWGSLRRPSMMTALLLPLLRLWNEFGTKRIPERPFFRQAIQGADRDLTPIIKANLDPKTLAIDRPLAGKLGISHAGTYPEEHHHLTHPPQCSIHYGSQAKKGLKSTYR